MSSSSRALEVRPVSVKGCSLKGRKTRLGKGKFPLNASSATYPTSVVLHRENKARRLSAASRFLRGSWSEQGHQYILRG